MSLIEKCLCGSTSFESVELVDLECRTCAKCFLSHQVVEMEPGEYLDYYVEDYPERRDVAYGQTHNHKKHVALMRLGKYGLKKHIRVLDVGTGDGAFVEVCRASEIGAVGCEIAPGDVGTEHCYPQDLRDCNFPTEHFDVVTMHDVLEHLVDPVTELAEIFRVLKPDGRLLLEVPYFWGTVEESGHHFKKVEHLWFFKKHHVVDLAKKAGFDKVHVSHPIPSKVLYDCHRPAVKRTSILVPPGIGDSYWSMVKMRSFCAALGVGIPDVYVSSLNKDHDRCHDYMVRVPFINAAGYLRHAGSESWRPIWTEAYISDGRSIFGNVEGCDYFLAYNGVMRHGKDIDPMDGPSDWMFPLWESLEERWYGQEFRAQAGPYIVAYFMHHGMYRKWIEELSAPAIGAMLHTLSVQTGCKIVLIGAKWDVGSPVHKAIEGAVEPERLVNMVGKTSLPECFALLRGANAVVGFPSGITIMATTFEVPTVMFWNKYFHEGFWMNSCPPQSRNEWYFGIDTKRKRATHEAIGLLTELAGE